jgi:YHS domain-containing protein
VTLRDRRELADSKPNFVASFRGQKFYFASQVAQAKFETDPARYAPAAYGADVVVLVDHQDVVEGTLDYAAWYKGRLFLFGSQENHDKFVGEPDKYSSPPGIE